MNKLPPTIIGISGTNGSGKDTVGLLLSERHNFLFVSVSDILRAELSKQGKSPARENMRDLSTKWRREFGLGVLVDLALKMYRENTGYQGLAIASLRNSGEADSVHEAGGIVVWLDAPIKKRYARIANNARGELRKVDDEKTFSEFIADEEAEMNLIPGADEAMLSMSGVKDKSDITIINDGDSIEAFALKLDQALGFS